MKVDRCRTCLTETNQTKTIRNTPLAEVYEKLSNVKLISEDVKPEAVCFTCYCQLQKCHNFATMAQKADSMLTQLRSGVEIPKTSLASLRTMIDSFSETHLSQKSDLMNIEIKQEMDPVKLEIEEFANIKNKDIFNENTEIKKDGKCKPKKQTKKKYMKNKHIQLTSIATDSYLENHDENDYRENSSNCDTITQQCSTHINSQIKKPYICDKCNKTFEHKHNLKSHIKTHIGEKLSICDRCGKAFPNGFQLKRHMRSHTGEKPYKCDQCGRSFSDRGNLQKHIIVHSGKKSFICTECDASFSHSGNLKRHMRSHTGEQPYFCDICKKTLPDASLLKRHMRIHTGEKPYECDACGKSYSDKSNFKTHMRRHTGEKPYKCNICDYMSAHSLCLKLHLAKKHSD